jgi:glutathione S-transferase
MKLFQFAYSPFAAKVRKCLQLKELAFELVEVPFMDRRQLVALTGGSIMVPVLADGAEVICDSPRITAYLERYPPSLRPAPLGAIPAIVESWADNVVEDVAFRIAAPVIEERIAALNGGREDARAMFRFTKERKFGAGCLEAWRRDAAELRARLVAMLAPLGETVARDAFILGQQPTLADAAVYGQLYMIESMIPGFVGDVVPALRDWYERVSAIGAR